MRKTRKLVSTMKKPRPIKELEMQYSNLEEESYGYYDDIEEDIDRNLG